MTVMAFFLLIAFFLAAFVYFWTINPGEVTIFFTADQSLTYPFAIVVVGALLCGLLLGFGIYFYSVAGTWLRGLGRNRLEKRTREVTAIYREGVARLLSGDLKKAGTLLRAYPGRGDRRRGRAAREGPRDRDDQYGGPVQAGLHLRRDRP